MGVSTVVPHCREKLALRYQLLSRYPVSPTLRDEREGLPYRIVLDVAEFVRDRKSRIDDPKRPIDSYVWPAANPDDNPVQLPLEVVTDDFRPHAFSYAEHVGGEVIHVIFRIY